MIVVVEPPRLASRIVFNCTPANRFLNIPVDGRHVVFSENVFYAFEENRIAEVWSVIDQAAIEAQLS